MFCIRAVKPTEAPQAGASGSVTSEAALAVSLAAVAIVIIVFIIKKYGWPIHFEPHIWVTRTQDAWYPNNLQNKQTKKQTKQLREFNLQQLEHLHGMISYFLFNI